jgi:hypothetical protein
VSRCIPNLLSYIPKNDRGSFGAIHVDGTDNAEEYPLLIDDGDNGSLISAEYSGKDDE